MRKFSKTLLPNFLSFEPKVLQRFSKEKISHFCLTSENPFRPDETKDHVGVLIYE